MSIRTGPRRGLVAAGLAAAFLVAGLSIAPASAHDNNGRWSLCHLTTEVTGLPRRVLAGESLEIDLHVRPYCLEPSDVQVTVFAVAIAPGTAGSDLVQAKRALLHFFDATDWGDRVHIGVSMPGKKGGTLCMATHHHHRARNCIERMDRITPAVEIPLAQAIEDGMRIHESWRPSGPDGADPRRRLVIVSVASRSFEEQFAGGCREALAAANRPKRQGMLLFSGHASGRPPSTASALARCVRKLASAPRYYLPDLVLNPVPFHPPRPRGPVTIGPRSMRVGTLLPEQLEFVDVREMPPWAHLTRNEESLTVRLDGWVPTEGVTLQLQARMLSPGVHDLTLPLDIDWVEISGVRGSLSRRLTRRVMVLQPRPLGREGE